MNRDDIIRMAQEAEALGNTATVASLTRFAELVADYEREQFARLISLFWSK
jgi:hypothetical protein